MEMLLLFGGVAALFAVLVVWDAKRIRRTRPRIDQTDLPAPPSGSHGYAGGSSWDSPPPPEPSPPSSDGGGSGGST